ncbi:MAG: sugar ABC transporter permease [Clostridia bacterium]|nr:sugar ABC transporter permease [Clostridia bacterium]
MDSVNMDNGVVIQKPTKNVHSSTKKKKLVFFTLMSLPFLIQAAIFYVYVNFSTITLSFFEYHYEPGVGDVSSFVWFKNFGYVLGYVFSPNEVSMFLVSFVMYAFILCIVTPVVVFFSFYIYKKFFLSGFFRIILFMPQVISSVVYVTVYKTMLGPVYSQLSGSPGIFDGNDTTVMIAVIGYTFWTAFGSNILLMSGAMGGIDDSVVDACYLDGCNMTKEFIHVTLPSIYPTITTFVVLDLTTLFTNQLSLMTFFGQNAPIKSVGYFMELNLLKTPGLYSLNETMWFLYPQLAAMGLLITLTVAPICIIVRKIMERVGPSED